MNKEGGRMWTGILLLKIWTEATCIENNVLWSYLEQKSHNSTENQFSKNSLPCDIG
jgi:hypothetical protein